MREANVEVQVIIKVAMLSAILFSELLLLVVMLFSYSLIKFRSSFVLVNE